MRYRSDSDPTRNDGCKSRRGLWWKIQDSLAKTQDSIRTGSICSPLELQELKHLRLASGLTREDLAMKMKSSARTVQNLEEGASANPSTILLYLETLARDLRDIFIKPTFEPAWISFPKNTWDPIWNAPSALLKPANRIVAYQGTRYLDHLKNLVRWCGSSESAAVLSFVARGGVGKTRIGVELCHQVRDQKPGDPESEWLAGFLQPGAFPKTNSPWEDFDFTDRNVLLVVDYASTRENLDVLSCIIPWLAKAPTKRIRLLLLDRNDTWIAKLTGHPDCTDVLNSPAFRRAFSAPDLCSILDPGNRQAMFESAVSSFRSRLNPKAEVRPAPDLTSPTYESVLMVHMLALLSLESKSNRIVSESDLLAAVLVRERRQWESALLARAIDPVYLPAAEKIIRGINEAGGASTYAEAKRIVKICSFLPSVPDLIQKEMLLAIHACYGSKEQYIGTLKPDLLWEHFISNPL